MVTLRNVSACHRGFAVLCAGFGVAVLIGGCTFKEAERQAELVLVKHYAALSTNGYQAALTCYGQPFLASVGEKESLLQLTKLNETLGVYRGHSVLKWRTFKKLSGSGKGTYVELLCQVSYSKHSAREKYIFQEQPNHGGFKILQRQITSQALSKDLKP